MIRSLRTMVRARPRKPTFEAHTLQRCLVRAGRSNSRSPPFTRLPADTSIPKEYLHSVGPGIAGFVDPSDSSYSDQFQDLPIGKDLPHFIERYVIRSRRGLFDDVAENAAWTQALRRFWWERFAARGARSWRWVHCFLPDSERSAQECYKNPRFLSIAGTRWAAKRLNAPRSACLSAGRFRRADL